MYVVFLFLIHIQHKAVEVASFSQGAAVTDAVLSSFGMPAIAHLPFVKDNMGSLTSTN